MNGGKLYRRSFPSLTGAFSREDVIVDMLPKMEARASTPKISARASTRNPKPPGRKKPEPPSTKNSPASSKKGKNGQTLSQAEYPPITPLAALTYTLIVSRVSSSNADKRKISHKAMNELADLESDRRYRNDDRARSFIQNVRNLIITSAIAIGESNKSINIRLERAAGCMKSNIAHHGEMRDMRMKHLEESRKGKTVPSIVAWFATLGISVTGIATLQQEAMKFIATHLPKLQDLQYATYFAGASLLAGIVLGVRKVINKVVHRKQEKTLDEFHKNKQDEEAKFSRLESKSMKEHFTTAIDTAATVYAEVFKLCETHYPEYLKENGRFKEFLEVKASHGSEQASTRVKEHGKREAEGRMNMAFLQEMGKDIAASISNGNGS